MNAENDNLDLHAMDEALSKGLDARMILYKFFNENKDNCYNYIINLYCSMRQNRVRHKPLACDLLKYFSDWIVSAVVTEQLNVKLKERIVECVLAHNDYVQLKFVYDAFKIEEDIEHFKKIVDDLLSKRNITQAFFLAHHFKMHKEFSINQILLPLLFIEKRNLVYLYLDSCPELIPEFIKALDDVCLDWNSIKNLISSLNIDVKWSTFNPRWFRRFIATMLKRYKVPDNNLNFQFGAARAALRHLLYKRYAQESISESSFKEFVTDIVKDDAKLQDELLIEMVCSNDGEAALRMADELKIPRNKWPDALQYFMDTEFVSKSSHSVNEEWDHDKVDDGEKSIHEEDEESAFLNLELDFSKVQIVINTDQFVNFVQDIMQNYDVVGFDSEWKPAFVGNSKQSLLQFGVTDKVYLIDLVALASSLEQWHLDYLFENIFCNPMLLKLGYGIHHDLKLLFQNCLNGTTHCNFAAVLDLGLFYPELLGRYPQISSILEEHCVRGSNDKNVDDLKGLSKLCYDTLGKPMCKKEQLTNWEKRPLSVLQVTYAALDAYCLVQIYERLSFALKEIGVDIQNVAKIYFIGTSKKESKRKNKEIKNEEKSRANIEDLHARQTACNSADNSGATHFPIAVKDIKVIVDNMFDGLGRRLRMFGIDTVSIPSGRDHTLAAKIALEEDRIVLSSGIPFEMIKSHVPEEMCVSIPTCWSAKKQAEYVIQHYNVKISDADIFSRCIMCNSNDFLQIPSKDLELLWRRSSPHYSKTVIDSPPFEIAHYGNGFVKTIRNCFVMHTGVHIKLHDDKNPLCKNVFHDVDDFMVCTGCGQVYWHGSHFCRAKTWLTKPSSPKEPV